MPTMNRRDFLKSCGAGVAVAGVGPGLMRLAFADVASSASDTLIVVFMRGGCDGLSLVPPIGGNDRTYYEQARPDLQIPVSGSEAALALSNSNGHWGLHPRASGLHDLYQSGHMAVVLGAGMPAPITRSHFDAQATMEMGTPGQQGIGSGWLTRHLQSMGLPSGIAIPGVSAGSLTSTSLISSTQAITMSDGGDFRLDSSHWSWNARDRYDDSPAPPGFKGLVETLPSLWAGGTLLDQAGRHTLDSLATLRSMDFDGYTPANGASYPGGEFGNQLKMLAQLIKGGVGLKIASIDIASWDTHTGQSYYFGEMVEDLSQGLHAFHADLAGTGSGNHTARTSILVMSEFGRRVRQNDSGTDHGYGNVMLALGGAVNGGHIYGMNDFAGLAPQQLFEGEDVQVTIDYRRVLSEAMIRRQGNNHLGHVFPGYSGYSPMGIFQGSDIAPDYSATGWDSLFKNGFE